MVNLESIQDSQTMFDNHYLLKRKIGGGGFSEVWLAHDTVAEIDVALKIYTPTGELDEEGKKDFRREFAQLCSLNHSNIIHAIGFGIFKEQLPYLAMSVCHDGSAKNLIGKASEAELWIFVEQVVSGLAYLHDKGIVHQDMKPDNVLKNSDGQYLIIDFGISTKTRNTLRRSNNNQAGVGTSWYMSIESFGKESPSIFARDIWAFGATLYEIMTGDAPFGQYGGIAQKSSGGKIPKIKQSYSDELKTLVYDCLALNAWDRPDAAHILKRVSDHNSGIVKSNKVRYINKKWLLGVISVSAVMAFVLLVLPPKQNVDILVNPNDSIFLARIDEANKIIQEEKVKQDISTIDETKLLFAFEIYKGAQSLEASDSIIQKGKDLWLDSQEIIDELYIYLYNKAIEYNDIGAERASVKFIDRSNTLKECISSEISNRLNLD